MTFECKPCLQFIKTKQNQQQQHFRKIREQENAKNFQIK